MTTITNPGRTHLRAYDRRRRRHIKDGTWRHPVPSADIRHHIVLLSAAGMSLTAIADAAQLSPGTVWPIAREGSRRYVQGATAAAILAVTPPECPPLPAGMVDITGTSRRLQALVAIGYTISDLSDRLGYKNMQQVWEWTRRRQSAVAQSSADKVRDLYERLSGTPGPSSRARANAQRNEWLPPLAWEDVDVDNPDAMPELGESGDEIVDEEAISRVLAGKLPFKQLRDAEKIALFREHLADWTFNPIMSLLGMSARTVKYWRERVAEDGQAAA
ncbi:hypothetical protein GCM10010399_44080 [Dactylosporangium fulvum]|uniref:Uncharacterized protein n=1 Tax=Dactylosporangium fulvum TaxID=53359 RepID=A0ABY5W970_9ACTN|nr:hypothetical protein [Dactylosporangium fulvum]UWP85925.1 hypothetical protein Dfulv_17400 [Dactylosporangium fulvum]